MALEERFGIAVAESELESVATVGQAVSLVSCKPRLIHRQPQALGT
jgi:acyl carrier protein